ncbi:MAG: hypothetical protein ACUVXF_11970 [Desulfobaccales bacterium]
MDLVIFEENKPFVLEALGNGEFDYMEAASEVFEADFFRFIKARALLDELAQKSYPTPWKKEDVPFWFYVASNLSMRLHPKPARRRSSARGLTGRITMTGRPLAIRIFCGRSPKIPMPKR